MSSSAQKAVSIVVMCIGVVLVAVGLALATPSEHIYTASYSSSVFDTDASAWNFEQSDHTWAREYVGGDAYNIIIGATLIAGRLAGTLVMKAIFVVGGAIVFCMGLLSFARSQKAATGTSAGSKAAKTRGSVASDGNDGPTTSESAQGPASLSAGDEREASTADSPTIKAAQDNETSEARDVQDAQAPDTEASAASPAEDTVDARQTHADTKPTQGHVH